MALTLIDVKANNILISYKNADENVVVKSVRLADLEDAAYVTPGSAIVGSQVGNQLWRSPEAHAQGAVSLPSDIFSFGIVVSLLQPSRPHGPQMYHYID